MRNSSLLLPYLEATLLTLTLLTFFSLQKLTDNQLTQIRGLMILNATNTEAGHNITEALTRSDDGRADLSLYLFEQLESINQSIRSIDIQLDAGDLNITLDLEVIERAVLELVQMSYDSKPNFQQLFSDVSSIQKTTFETSFYLFDIKNDMHDLTTNFKSFSSNATNTLNSILQDSIRQTELLDKISITLDRSLTLTDEIFNSEDGWGSSIKDKLEEASTILDTVADSLDIIKTFIDTIEAVISGAQQLTLTGILNELKGGAFKNKVGQSLEEMEFHINVPETDSGLDILLTEAKAVTVRLDECTVPTGVGTIDCVGSKFTEFRNPLLGSAVIKKFGADHVTLKPYFLSKTIQQQFSSTSASTTNNGN